MQFGFLGGSFKNHEYYTTYVTFCKVFLIFLSFGSIFTPRFYAICTISLYVSSNSPFFWRNPHFGEKCCEIYVLKWFSLLFLRSAFGTFWGKNLIPQRSFPRPVLALRGKNHRLRPLRAAAFTLDIYGHVTQKMKQESPARMERFIAAVNQ